MISYQDQLKSLLSDLKYISNREIQVLIQKRIMSMQYMRNQWKKLVPNPEAKDPSLYHLPHKKPLLSDYDKQIILKSLFDTIIPKWEEEKEKEEQEKLKIQEEKDQNFNLSLLKKKEDDSFDVTKLRKQRKGDLNLQPVPKGADSERSKSKRIKVDSRR